MKVKTWLKKCFLNCVGGMIYQLTARQTVFFLETFNHTKTTGPNLLKDHRLSTQKKKRSFLREKKKIRLFFSCSKRFSFSNVTQYRKPKTNSNGDSLTQYRDSTEHCYSIVQDKSPLSYKFHQKLSSALLNKTYILNVKTIFSRSYITI